MNYDLEYNWRRTTMDVDIVIKSAWDIWMPLSQDLKIFIKNCRKIVLELKISNYERMTVKKAVEPITSQKDQSVHIY